MEVARLIEILEGDAEFNFASIDSKHSGRKDLHAFILLDRLLSSGGCLISAAEHDIIYLDVDLDKLAVVATEEHIRELRACGVMLEEDSLAMFV